MNSLSILYRDEHLVAVNKPSGLLVHPSEFDRKETESAMKTVRDHLGRWVYPVHRLDRSTSGALVFALDRETARLMTGLFFTGCVSKRYLAVVRGFTKEEERVDHPLKQKGNRTTCRSAGRDRPGKQAITDYRRLATIEIPQPVGRYPTARFSLVSAVPVTGRTHQIRRHMKHIFHPVVGDTTYGDGKQNDFFRRNYNCRRLLLHASAIGFAHPHSQTRIEIEAPPDDGLYGLLRELHWEASAPLPAP